MTNVPFEEALKQFAVNLTANFASSIPAQPEDQLKPAIAALLTATGAAFGWHVASRTEAQVTGLGGRPDVGVEVGRLLTGYIELKAPGKGARPQTFRGDDQKQWEKFKTLPNLIYTDGTEWTLFRSGVAQGATLHMAGDVTKGGATAVNPENAAALSLLLRDFLQWQPISPSTARALAETLAPLCRLIRDDVAQAVQNPASNISQLATEWRQTLFPDADDARFADAYAQTLTYALLLARFSGQENVTPSQAADALDVGHGLLAQALRILSQTAARKEIGIGLDLLVRVINVINPETLQHEGNDPWLYFYEEFLAAYDRKLRNDYGVYYTPPQVIQAQVHLISRLLQDKFDEELSFAAPNVVLLDPAAGTGAYPLAVLQHGLEHAAQIQGPGSISGHATEMARNVHAFEFLVGPYAVAHLRLTQTIQKAGGTLPEDGIHVYLTDTLESPHAQPPGQLTLMYQSLSEEHRRAQKVKADTRVLVCVGNPPYDRQEIGRDEVGVERHGGWIRYGDDGRGGILEDFLAPARAAGRAGDVKNLYNDYVYFWRWALWKVFEATQERGIVCLITAASYLRGPGFVGMRQLMRQTFDDLWIIDLEGGNLGARKTENVFNIQTPVAIALGVRYGEPQPNIPANVRYTRLTGTRREKLEKLDAVLDFEDLDWKACSANWQAPFLPNGAGSYYGWPLLTDIFPLQYSGVQFKRTWPIGQTKTMLQKRWTALVTAPTAERPALFRETDRLAHQQFANLDGSEPRAPAISTLTANAPVPAIVRYGFRSFDRQWAFADARLGDRMRPPLWRNHGPKQVYLVSLLTEVLGLGPAATISAEVPDLHYFRGSFGGKHVIPLWRDADAVAPNITTGLLDQLSATYGVSISPEDLFAYSYALMAGPSYVDRYSEELVEPGPRLPLTRDASLFEAAVRLGRQLICIQTYRERFLEPGDKAGRVPPGLAKNTVAIPTASNQYPKEFSYDEKSQTLFIGAGAFAPVAPEVWGFRVSGLEVVRSWLAYRMQRGAGKTSSALDKIRPEAWTAEMTTELLHLLWVLEKTISLQPALTERFEEIIKGPLFAALELPQPSAEQRQPAHMGHETPEQEALALTVD
jgi:hypothetical protein